MSNNIIEAVLQITGEVDNEITRLKINAILNEILSYLNRKDVTDEIFPSIVTTIADCMKNSELGTLNITSLTEGDMSVSYSTKSPFFGKLESFKVIRGLN